MLSRLILIVSLPVLAPAARGQSWTYSFEGAVQTVTTGPVPDTWSVVNVGDAFQFEVTVDLAVPASGSNPQRALYEGAVQSVVFSVGAVTTSALASGDVEVQDDFSVVNGICSDSVTWRCFGGTDYVENQITISTSLVSLTAGCPVALTGLELPIAPDLEVFVPALHPFTLRTPGGGVIEGETVSLTTTPLFVDRCSGDGGDQQGCSDCPCGNDAPAGTVGGCLNASGTAARLLAFGEPRVSNDSLRIELRAGTPDSFGVLTSGDSLAPTNPTNPCFGLGSGVQSLNLDGLRCAVASVRRHGARATDSNGDLGLSTPGFGPPDGPLAGLLAQGGFLAGDTRHFQLVYREDPALVCRTGQNTTQAITVVVLP